MQLTLVKAGNLWVMPILAWEPSLVEGPWPSLPTPSGCLFEEPRRNRPCFSFFLSFFLSFFPSFLSFFSLFILFLSFFLLEGDGWVFFQTIVDDNFILAHELP